MRYTPSFFLRYLFECPCQRVRRLLSRYHWAYLRKRYPNQRFTLEWRKTSTMVASQVFAADGTPEAIVTTLLLDGRIRHDVVRLQPVDNSVPEGIMALTKTLLPNLASPAFGVGHLCRKQAVHPAMELTNEILDHMEAALKAYKTPDNATLTDEAMQLLGILESSMSCVYMHDHIAQSDMCEWHN